MIPLSSVTFSARADQELYIYYFIVVSAELGQYCMAHNVISICTPPSLHAHSIATMSHSLSYIHLLHKSLSTVLTVWVCTVCTCYTHYKSLANNKHELAFSYNIKGSCHPCFWVDLLIPLPNTGCISIVFFCVCECMHGSLRWAFDG